MGEFNFGTRVTCYAWGEGVYTCGYGVLTEPPDTVNYFYTDNFRATSAASAIIAGAAILVQQMASTTIGRRLAPAQMRALLGDRTLGTIVVDDKDAPVGVMPDLAKVAASLGAVPDVYLRDSVGDAGDVPNTSVFQSPDIILRQIASGDPDADFGENSPVANWCPERPPRREWGQLDLRTRPQSRAGRCTARDRHGVLERGQHPLAPVDWHLIGQINVGTVHAGGALHVAGPFHWVPGPGQAPASHGCFVVVLDQARDPQPPSLPASVGTLKLGWTEFLAYVGANNNVAWRNFTLVQPLAGTWQPLPFWIRGAWDEPREFGLDLCASLPNGAEVVWELPDAIAEPVARATARHIRDRAPFRGGVRLQLFGLGQLAVPALRLEPGSQHACTLKVRLPAEVHDPCGAGGYEISVRQVHDRVCVGQVTWSWVTEAGR